MWEEEGTATRIGNYYKLDVHHFSWWNIDVPYDKGYITGHIKDCRNNALPNVVFTINGIYTGVTDSNGDYYIWAPASIPLTFQVLAASNSNLFSSSAVYNIPALASGQVYNMPTVSLNCVGVITGNVVDCSGDPFIGYVSYPLNGSTVYQSINGQYNLSVPPLTQINLSICSGNYQFDTLITTPAYSVTASIGSVTVCDSVSQNYAIPDNYVLVDGGPWNNLLIALDTTLFVFQGRILAAGFATEFNIGYQGAPQYIDWTVPLTAPGQAPANSQNMNLFYLNSFYQLAFYNDSIISGFVQLIEVGSVGGRIKAKFDVTTTGTDMVTNTNYIVHAMGNLNVPRTF